MLKRVLLSCVGFIVALLSVDAQEVLRPVNAFYSAEVGGAQLVDTYLTPLKYDGWSTSLSYDRWQAMKFSPEKWVMRLHADAEVDNAENPARNATMWYWGADFSWSMLRRWSVPAGVKLGFGGKTTLDLGCLYNERNGNNPASVKAAWTVDLTGFAAKRFMLKKLPIDVRYTTSLPVVGAFFSPDYGELYYEIYMGNHNGLAHCAYPGNYFSWDNNVSLDFHFGNTILRIGYHGKILSTKVNDLTSRITTNAFVIGIGGDWVSMSPTKKPDLAKKTIYAPY